MYKFKKDVSTMRGKSYRAGSIVPDGAFLNIDEMIKAGDVELVVMDVIEETIEDEIVEETIDEIEDEIEEVYKPKPRGRKSK